MPQTNGSTIQQSYSNQNDNWSDQPRWEYKRYDRDKIYSFFNKSSTVRQYNHTHVEIRWIRLKFINSLFSIRGEGGVEKQKGSKGFTLRSALTIWISWEEDECRIQRSTRAQIGMANRRSLIIASELLQRPSSSLLSQWPSLLLEHWPAKTFCRAWRRTEGGSVVGRERRASEWSGGGQWA